MSWRHRVPKGPLLRMEYTRGFWFFARNRCANFWRIQIGCIAVTWRAPYLEYVARVHYPQYFAD